MFVRNLTSQPVSHRVTSILCLIWPLPTWTSHQSADQGGEEDDSLFGDSVGFERQMEVFLDIKRSPRGENTSVKHRIIIF